MTAGRTPRANDWNQRIIEEFRAKGGKGVGQFGDRLLLLTNTGAKSGAERINPLAYLRDGERYVVIASKGGAPTNPDWFHNVRVHPDVVVEVAGERFEARATVAEGAERDRLYAEAAEAMPAFAQYQQNTTRTIPVVILERTG